MKKKGEGGRGLGKVGGKEECSPGRCDLAVGFSYGGGILWTWL